MSMKQTGVEQSISYLSTRNVVQFDWCIVAGHCNRWR